MKYIFKVNPHNDLIKLALYNLNNINKKAENGDDEDIDLDCLNCIIPLAFAVESIANYVGAEKIYEWKEKQTYFKKMKQVCNVGDHVYDEKVEPYLTLKTLKSLRDYIAHAKPVVKQKEFPIGTPKEMESNLVPLWNEFTSFEFVNHAYKMVRKFEKELLKAHHIEYCDTGTYAHSL